jgi:hypothetical protein
MFESVKVMDLESKVIKLEVKIEDQDKLIKGKTETIDGLQKEIKNLKEDHAIALERKTQSVDMAVQKATKQLRDEVQTLTIAKNGAEKEAAMLTKAFENLGFDVKDMKDILNKLVDGVVSKNQIQLVK